MKYSKKSEKVTAPKRPSASERGVPQTVVDALISVLGVDEDDISLDAQLEADLGADELDRCELMMTLEEAYGVATKEHEKDDPVDGWKLVADVIHSMKRAGARV